MHVYQQSFYTVPTQHGRSHVGDHQLGEEWSVCHRPVSQQKTPSRELESLSSPVTSYSVGPVYNGFNQTKPQIPHSPIPQTTFSRDARQNLRIPTHNACIRSPERTSGGIGEAGQAFAPNSMILQENF